MSEPVLAQQPGSPVSATARRLTQLLLVALAITCFVIFWWVSRLLGVPAEFRHGGSLLQQPTVGTSVIGVLGSIALLVGCALFAGALLERRWMFGGLTAATAGFSAWSMRGGRMREALFSAPSTMIFAKLALEMLILGGTVGLIWCMVWKRHARLAPTGLPLDSEKPADARTALTAVAAQVVVMGLAMLILAQTDAKKQAVASVLIAAMTGTGVAEAYFSGRDCARWYWAGPLIVGLFGYVAAIFSNSGWQTGTRELAGPFAALARVLPIDYASVGMCGALLGYGWMTADGTENDTPVPATGN